MRLFFIDFTAQNLAAQRLAAPRGVVRGVAALAICVALLGVIPQTSTAEPYGAAHSIHMLARVPTRCVVRDISRIVLMSTDGVATISAAGHGVVTQGSARFRIDCNTPYHLDVRPGRRQVRSVARLIPLSAEADELGQLLPTAGETAIAESVFEPTTVCTLADRQQQNVPCPGNSDAAGVSPVLPRTTGVVALTRDTVFEPAVSDTVTARTHPAPLDYTGDLVSFILTARY